MCAYLKTYHPKEFMVALFNSFDGKPDKFEGVFQEARRLGVDIEPISFRNPSIMCKLEDDKFIYGLKLVKHCNVQMAEGFKSLKHKDYAYFVDLLIDIAEKTSIDSRQMKILICLDFFGEFGNKEKLMSIYDAFKNGKGVKYDKKYAEKTKTKRVELLHEFEEKADNEQFEYISPYENIMNEKEYLGFIRTIYPDFDTKLCAIMDIDKKYTPKVLIHNFKTGQQVTVKVKKDKFYDSDNMDKLLVGDIIRIKKISHKGKWKKTDEGWIQDENIKEMYLDGCTIVQRNTKE